MSRREGGSPGVAASASSRAVIAANAVHHLSRRPCRSRATADSSSVRQRHRGTAAGVVQSARDDVNELWAPHVVPLPCVEQSADPRLERGHRRGRRAAVVQRPKEGADIVSAREPIRLVEREARPDPLQQQGTQRRVARDHPRHAAGPPSGEGLPLRVNAFSVRTHLQNERRAVLGAARHHHGHGAASYQRAEVEPPPRGEMLQPRRERVEPRMHRRPEAPTQALAHLGVEHRSGGARHCSAGHSCRAPPTS